MQRRECIFLLHIASKSYREPAMERPTLRSLELNRLVQLAVSNDMLYYAAKESSLEDYDCESLRLMRKVTELCEKEVDKIRSAVTALEQSLNGYISIKTCKTFPRIPDDLDVYVPDFDRAVRCLKSRLEILEYSDQLREAVFGASEVAKIHVHSRIGWAGAAFIDNELLGLAPSRAAFHGLQITVPNNEAELLVNMAHINYEKFSFDISDLLHIYRLAGQVDWKTIQAQVAKYRWRKSFERTAELLDGIHWTAYENASPFEDIIEPYRTGRRSCLEFPFSFPRSHITRSFIERGVLGYMLRKAFQSSRKSIGILLSGRTCEAQGKTPRELEIYEKLSPRLKGH